MEANKVNLQIPPFCSHKPEIWFYQVEVQFEINGVTTEVTKFNYLVSQLEPKYVESIWDITSDLNIVNKYTTAKKRLLNILKEDENKRLVSGVELGDMTPSQLLQKMKSLASEDISDNTLKTLWLDKLPNHIKNVLLVSGENLDKLASMADKIDEMSPRKELCINQIDVLMRRMADLELQVAQLSASRRSRSPTSRGIQNERSCSQQRSSSKTRNDLNGKYCYYHFKFGPKCIPSKCIPPCDWIYKSSGNGDQ